MWSQLFDSAIHTIILTTTDHFDTSTQGKGFTFSTPDEVVETCLNPALPVGGSKTRRRGGKGRKSGRYERGE